MNKKKKRKKKKAALLLSGGKDSVFAFHKASASYDIDVAIIMIPKNPASWMFHAINAKHAVFVAKALGIKHIIVKKTSGEKDSELLDLEKAIKKARENFKIEAVVSGAIASSYQKQNIEKILAKYGLEHFAPSWQMNQYNYMKSLLDYGIRFIIVGIFCEGIDESYLGKVIDENDLEKLNEASKKYGFNMSFEGGEAETLAIDGPLFKKRLEVEGKKVKRSDYEFVFEIEKVRLVDKD
ncbi:MAG: diphthine--ammonia ligase [Candidatus Pacearchaeota archaeon]